MKHPSVRDQIVKALGSKCQMCGFDKDPRVLQILYNEQDRKDYLKKNRYAFYLEVLTSLQQEPGSDKYSLVCANCKFGLMYDRREDARSLPPSKASTTIIWQTSLGVHDTLGKFPWLERLRLETYPGADVLVVTKDRVVYRQGSVEPLEESWGKYADYAGFPEDLGDEPITIVRET